ncbi:hypothetical protein NDU88_005030 [Pleurodeles waltl]|uniref:Uncharacterized protein n=1 Tax=Pleurodeles waltl TaxID=8319 RepID=A0AAV7NVF6_PLEWA|nr:hypothetical protein NDU88_005030 [Pleurodeles waltl]
MQQFAALVVTSCDPHSSLLKAQCGVAKLQKRQNVTSILRSAAGRQGGVMTVDVAVRCACRRVAPPALCPQPPQSLQVPDGLLARSGTTRQQGGRAAGQEDDPQ